MEKRLKGEGKVAFGVFADGSELKVAHLSLKRGGVFLHELKTITLPQRLEEKDSSRTLYPEEGAVASAEPAKDEIVLQELKEDTDAGTLLSLFSPYKPKRYLIAYGLSEPSVYYHALEIPFGPKISQLKKRAIQELAAIRPTPPSLDTVDVIPSHEKGTLCVARENGLRLLDLLQEIRPFIGGRFPRVSLIDSAEVSLMNLVRLNYQLKDREVTLIVYVGAEFCRIILMKGDIHMHFAPLLTEGVTFPDLASRLVSRILLEQDSRRVPEIRRIVVAGNAEKIHLKDVLHERFPFVEVEYLKLDALLRVHPQQQTVEACAEYAIPIAAAWRALDRKNRRFFSVNLLPAEFIEKQKFFKLRWHGYALIALIFFCTLFFTWQILESRFEIRMKKSIVTEKQQLIQENLKLRSGIEGLQAKITEKKGSVALYESLIPGCSEWTIALRDMADEIYELNSIWLTSITSTADGGTVIMGISMYRNRIPKFAAHYPGSTIKRMTEKRIQTKKVYEFELQVPRASLTR
jgi:hypothetical protein